MSKTDKTKPAKYQISDYAAEHGGYIDYRAIKWRRQSGEKFWRAEEMQRKERALRNYWKDVRNDY